MVRSKTIIKSTIKTDIWFEMLTDAIYTNLKKRVKKDVNNFNFLSISFGKLKIILSTLRKTSYKKQRAQFKYRTLYTVI